MNRVINPTPIGGGGGGLQPTIRATAPVGSTVSCDGQTKVVGSEGYVDFVVSAEPVNILPEGVQGLESIESTGGQYLKTGYKATQDTSIEMDFETAVTAKYYLGSEYADTSQLFILLGESANLRFYTGSYTGYTLGTISTTGNNHLELTPTMATFNGTNTNLSIRSEISNNEMYIFSINKNGTIRDGATWTAQMKLKLWKLWNGTNLLRHLIPCIYNSQVGMWDTVSNSFFGNQGTGSFIAGEPKEWTDYPSYTVTVNGASQMVKVDKVGLFPVLFN